MTVKTIEDALSDMGNLLVQSGIPQQARDAVSQGDVLEVTILVSPAAQGAAVTMHSLVASNRQSHGRLIRLT